jgi:hypothetical protein
MTEDQVQRFRGNVLVSSLIRGGRLSDAPDSEIRAIIRAAIAAVGDEWRPMSVEAKNGEECIIYCPETDTMLIAWWDADAPTKGWHWTTTDGPYFYSGPNGFDWWRPLPKAPDVTEDTK